METPEQTIACLPVRCRWNSIEVARILFYLRKKTGIIIEELSQLGMLAEIARVTEQGWLVGQLTRDLRMLLGEVGPLRERLRVQVAIVSRFENHSGIALDHGAGHVRIHRAVLGKRGTGHHCADSNCSE